MKGKITKLIALVPTLLKVFEEGTILFEKKTSKFFRIRTIYTAQEFEGDVIKEVRDYEAEEITGNLTGTLPSDIKLFNSTDIEKECVVCSWVYAKACSRADITRSRTRENDYFLVCNPKKYISYVGKYIPKLAGISILSGFGEHKKGSFYTFTKLSNDKCEFFVLQDEKSFDKRLTTFEIANDPEKLKRLAKSCELFKNKNYEAFSGNDIITQYRGKSYIAK